MLVTCIPRAVRWTLYDTLAWLDMHLAASIRAFPSKYFSKGVTPLITPLERIARGVLMLPELLGGLTEVTGRRVVQE